MPEEIIDPEFAKFLHGQMASVGDEPTIIHNIPIANTYPGFELEGLMMMYRVVAETLGLHIAGVTVMTNTGPVIYVIASKKIELTQEDIALLIPGYQPT